MEYKYNNKTETIHLEDKDEIINLRGLIEEYSHHWKWIALSVIMFLIGTFLLLRYTPSGYTVSTTIFIDDKDKGGLSSELSAFEDLGIAGGSKTSIVNEIGVLKSRTLIEDVVKELGINVTYSYKGKFLDNELYRNIPFKVNFLVHDSILYNLDETFLVTAITKNSFKIEQSTENVENIIVNKVDAEKNFKMDFGEINIHSQSSIDEYIGVPILIRVHPLRAVVDYYNQKINVDKQSIKSSILVITLEDFVRTKAIDILNHLVMKYNENAISYKSLITKNTDKFINERIDDISNDLTAIDKGVEQFKIENKISDIEYEANLNLESNSALEKQKIELSSQIQLVNYLTKHMLKNKDELIPSSTSGLNDPSITRNTEKYNNLMLERDRIIVGSSPLNPTVINLEYQMKPIRRNIIQSLNNAKSSLEFKLNEARNQGYQFGSKKREIPKQEREYQDIKRKQKIIETLYLYLLQKREENAITLGMPVPNAKVIDSANGNLGPSSPKRKVIYMIAFVLGVLIPIIIISIISFFDNKIRKVEDIEKKLKAPILGDIPITKSKQKIVASNDNSDSVAEAFRLLRTNVNFMLSNHKNRGKIVYVTSTIAGEGKTFVSLNLAEIIAATNKKVLLIGGDLRKPKLTQYLGLKKGDYGLSDYLANSSVRIQEIISSFEDSKFDIIQTGDAPINPSELLMNGRFNVMLNYARERYDYIIVDTPPVSLVTDTLLISDFADLLIYTIRIDYLDKRLLNIPKMLYEKERLKNMALLINATNFEKKGYGYGYGYGYGNQEKTKKKWWRKNKN